MSNEVKYRLLPLANRLAIDRMVSRDEINLDSYPNADRGISLYKEMVPSLDYLLSELTKGNRKVQGLDVGCGTGRAAAELMAAYYPNLDMKGITLISHPPVSGHEFLPKDRIKICHAGNTGYPDHSFNFLIAVGSLDTSNTIFEEGQAVLRLVNKGGYFIFAPAVWKDIKKKETEKLENYAKDQGFSCYIDMNWSGLPNFIFHNNS